MAEVEVVIDQRDLDFLLVGEDEVKLNHTGKIFYVELIDLVWKSWYGLTTVYSGIRRLDNITKGF